MRAGVWFGAVISALSVALATATVAGASLPAWTTYHHDAARSGVDPDSTSPVAASLAWQSPALDGKVYGQPLVYGSRVYVATENDSVYALDALTGGIVWQTHLATAVPQALIPCSAIGPAAGITSTPVIDPATGRIYVVGITWDGSQSGTIAHDMFALNLADGSVASGPVPVDAPGSSPAIQLQRPGLALDAGKVLIGYGSNNDCGSFHGYLVAAPEGGGKQQFFEVDARPGDSEGSIWASGNAPAIDATGNIWVASSNGKGLTYGLQDAVIKLDPGTLTVGDFWAPRYWRYLDARDLDLGSSMPLLLPGGWVFQIGKQGVGYIVSAAHLGGLGSTPHFAQTVCSGSKGGGIYHNGVIYVTCDHGIYALSFDTASGTFTPLPGWSITATTASANDPPIFAGGLVWSTGFTSGVVYGLDPATGSATAQFNLGGLEHFTSPSAAGGSLFVANNDQSVPGVDQVSAFRIASWSQPSSATVLTLGSSANPAGPGQAVTLTATVSPAPDAGTVSFTDGGAPIAGCGAVAVSVASGQAACNTTFGSAGDHQIRARYSGDPYYLGSAGTLTQSVT